MAIQKADLSPNEIWYIGNDKAVDMVGAKQAGMNPVFYDDRSAESKLREKNDDFDLDFPYIRLKNWNDLIEKIKNFY